MTSQSEPQRTDISGLSDTERKDMYDAQVQDMVDRQPKGKGK